MERILYTRVNGWLEAHNKLSPCQYGFRVSRSTADSVFNVVNDLYGARDRGETVATCFLDVKKAFDSIHHGELLARLVDLGIPKIYTNWFHAYLENRK